MTTDQAESGASRVSRYRQHQLKRIRVDAEAARNKIGWPISRGDVFVLLDVVDSLEVGLERVTAERDAALEVVEAASQIALHEEYGSHRLLRQALARFDATRKAAADVEEGK